MTHPTDSFEYEILKEAVKRVKGVEGAIVEIGTRQGGSMMHIIDALNENQDSGRTVISIDPYGHIPYNDGKTLGTRYDYTNEMRNEAMQRLYGYVRGMEVNFLFFNLESTEFFSKFEHGVPVYEVEKRIETRYAFAFLDGSHDFFDILEELLFFSKRMAAGAVVVVDDIDFEGVRVSDLIEISAQHNYGFDVLQRGNKKIAFIKR